jgi:hypothetical protein
MTMRMRPLLLVPLLSGLLSFVTQGTAQAETDPPVSGSWDLTFTPDSVKTVGTVLARSGDTTDVCNSCSSEWQFPEPGAGDGRSTRLRMKLDASGCSGDEPCDLAAVPSPSFGFQAPLHFDGTTFSGAGQGMFLTGGDSQCPNLRPAGTDRISFTITESSGTPTLNGELTVLLSMTHDDCKLLGYEVYTGTFTGKRFGIAPPTGSNPVPNSGGVNPSATDPLRGVNASALNDKAVRADHFAAAAHSRPVLSTHVASARELPWSPKRLLISALLAMVLVALLPFPAELFNSTLKANYDEVRGWFRFLPARARADAGSTASAASTVPPWLGFALLVGLTALLQAFLDPALGFDRASLVLFAGLALSVAAVGLLAGLPARWWGRRHEAASVLRLYPLGLIVAALCVLVSRLTSFEPGYLYGVIAGFALTRSLADNEKGRLEIGKAAFLLGVAVLAFIIRIPVHAATVSSGSVGWSLIDTVLAAVFAAGVEANILGLLPLRFLPGEEVFAWSKRVWAVAFGLNAFVFLHALAAQAGEDSPGTSLAVALALFTIFASVSVAFWAWFRFRPTRGEPVAAGIDG